MSKCLENFYCRIKLGVVRFLAASLMALAIALMTVSFQTVKAASTNPADTLHCE